MTSIRILGLVVFVSMLGCGGEASSKVRGRVTLDGVPLESGLIRFISSDGKGSPAVGIIEDGDYLIPKIALGKMRVEIEGYKAVNPRKSYDTADSPIVNVKKQIVPPRYNVKSELVRDIQSGENPLEFELSSK